MIFHQKLRFALWIFLVLIFCMQGRAQSGIHSLQVKDLAQQPIQLSTYKGKKLIVAVFNGSKIETGSLSMLRMLDTVYQRNKTVLNILAVPSIDSGMVMPASDLLLFLQNQIGVTYPLMSMAKVKKANGNNQHPLFKWLTNQNSNGHFDIDAGEYGQLFIISETGILYALQNTAGKSVSVQQLENILSKSITK